MKWASVQAKFSEWQGQLRTGAVSGVSETVRSRVRERLGQTARALSHVVRGYFFRFSERLTFRAPSRETLFVLFFVASILIGMWLKLSAEQTITIGHDDYRLPPAEILYDLNHLQAAALERGASLAIDPRPVYPACEFEE
jgi:hypothetical protein